jgi:hypothetical protein
LNYDPDSGWLIAAATQGGSIFVWQHNLRGDTWTGAQRAEPGVLDSMTTMHGRVYLGIDRRGNRNATQHPFIAADRLGSANWSARHALPDSPQGSRDLLLQADPAHNRLQAIYDAPDPCSLDHIDHQVRAANGSWSTPTRITRHRENDFPSFLVLTHRRLPLRLHLSHQLHCSLTRSHHQRHQAIANPSADHPRRGSGQFVSRGQVIARRRCMRMSISRRFPHSVM